jgi:hypothetical protein
MKTAGAKAAAVGRVGTPEDIAHAVSFFVSEGAGFVRLRPGHLRGRRPEGLRIGQRRAEPGPA